MTTACDSTDSAYIVALAYLMQKVPYVFPIVGGRKVEHLHDNINSLEVALKPEHFKKIEAATPFDPGFPTNMMVRLLAVLPQAVFLTQVAPFQGDGSEYSVAWMNATLCDAWPTRDAIRPLV